VTHDDDEPARLDPATGSRDEGHREYRATAPDAQPRGGPVPLRALLVAALVALGLEDLARELGLDGPPDDAPPDPPASRPSWCPEAAADAA